MLRDALIEAFPSRGELAQMVRVRLGENLAAISADRAGLREVAFEPIEWANANGKAERLLRAAVKENAGSRSLRAFALSLGYLVDKQGVLVEDALSALYARRAAAAAERADVHALRRFLALPLHPRSRSSDDARAHRLVARAPHGRDRSYAFTRERARVSPHGVVQPHGHADASVARRGRAGARLAVP